MNNLKKFMMLMAGGNSGYTGTVTFKQFIQSSDGGAGTLNFNNAALPNGGASTYTLGGTGSYIQTTVPSTTSNSDAISLCLSARDDFNYYWDNRSNFLLAYYHYLGNLYYALAGDVANAVSLGVTVSAGDILRIQRTSSTSVALKRSTDSGANFTTLTTLSVIDNVNYPFPDIKIINALQGASKKLQSVSGGGLLQKDTLPRAFGTIYSASTWTNLNGFLNASSAAAVVSNKLNFSLGSGTFSNFFSLDKPTCLEQWSMNCLAKVTLKDASSYGFGLGTNSISNTLGGAKYTACGRFAMDNGGASGKVIINGGSANTQLAISTTGLTFAVNDIINLTVTRSFNTLTVTAFNVTTDPTGLSPVSCNYTFVTFPNAAPYLGNTGNFSVFNLGGTYTINSLSVTTVEQQNARIVIIGDSKAVGYNATAIANRIGNILEGTYGATNVVTEAGGSDGLTEHLARINDLQSLTPTEYLILGASNDFRALRSGAAINADYASLVTQLLLSGRVVHSTGLKETVLDQSSLQTYINSNYSAGNIIDTLGTTLTLDADGVHPLDAGMATFSGLLTSSGKL